LIAGIIAQFDRKLLAVKQREFTRLLVTFEAEEEASLSFILRNMPPITTSRTLDL